MNQAEVSGLLCVGLHDTNGGEESCATECPKMSQDSSHETTKFDVVMVDPAMYSDHSNANACLDGYQHTGMMAGIQPVEEVRFGSTQHFEGVVADSEEESLSSSPETSSTTNYGYMEQNLQNIYSALDEMVDKEGPVMLNPEFVLCDKTLHHQPHLTFSSDGFKIEYFDWDSCEDDEMIALYWDVSDIICIGCKWSQSVESALITLLVGSSAETRNSGPVRVEFCLSDPHWPRKQQKICHLASRYQEIWNNIPSDDFASENWSIEPSLFFPKQYFSGTDDFEDVIYPKGDPDAVSISSRDVELLLPETFVNDTIIDFYIKYLSTRIETTEKRRYHFFNSFFFRKLADLDKDQGRAPEGRSAFLRVRKWTRKIDIFAKDFLFIPVNFNLHWSLVVICYPGEVDTFEDGETKTSGKVPCILHMDSLKGSHSGLKDIIQSYLWEEWKERHPESASDSSDKFLNLRFVPLELPQQDNSFDCGLFLLHYVELFLMDAPTSFNPLKIDVFSSFLSDDWFVPAEASLKRSLIRKLIHKLVTEPSQNYPKLACGNEQLDERHQRSENAEQEATREFLAQGCAAGDPDSVCTIAGTQQQSTSISLNDSEKALPDSGCILETGAVSMFTVQEMQVCPPDNDIVLCLTDAKNEPPLADSDNQLDLTPCAPEGAEVFKGDGCVVKDKDIHEESLHNNQKISNQAEVKVHDIMDSMCCPFSDNAEEEMACQEHSLGRNTNEVDDGCLGASQDMDSVRMLDAGKDDIGPDPESTKREAEDGRCDLPEDINSVAIGDINKDVSEHSLERNIIEAEDGRCDISENTGSVLIGDINKDFADRSFEKNIVEAEDTKHEDTHVNKDVSEHPLERNIVEAEDGRCDISEDTGSVVIGAINKDFAERSFERNVVEAEDTKHEDTHVNKDISEHSLERNIVEAEDGRCDISEDTGSVVIGDINKDFAERSFERNVVEAEDTKHEDTHVNKDVSEHSYKRNIVEAEDGRCDISEDTGSVVIGDINKDFAERSFGKNVAEAEDTKHEEGTSTTADKINDSEQYVTSELKEGNADNGITSGSTVSCESKEGNTNNIMAGDSTNGTDETHADSEDAHNNLVTGEAVPCEDDTTCANAEMPYVDSTSSATNETGSEYKPSDAKRPLHDSTSEDTNILVSDDKCSQKDVQCTEAKQERHYKRRKVLASEADKRRTRSSSMAPSLD